MKVFIGPYKDWIGPWQIADRIFFWLDRCPIDDAVFDRWDYKLHDKFGNWLASTWVSKFCDWIDSKRQREIEIRIDPYDTWSLDHTLALIVHPMLLQLKEKNHGYFSSDPEDAPHIGQEEGTDFTDDSRALDRYNWIMDELIWTFEQLKDNKDYEMFYTEENGWDFEANEKYNERINNGLRLFGKYYRALWD